MEKRILLGSIIAVVMLLLMPSIPAIQQKIVKDEIKDKILSEIPEQIDFKDIKELINTGKLDRIKHPFLLAIVWFIAFLYCFRMGCLLLMIWFLITNDISNGDEQWERIWNLVSIMDKWVLFWLKISETYGWNWDRIFD